MDTTKIIRGVINATRYTVTAPVTKEDYGLYLLIEGADLPDTYEVDFSNEETAGTSVTMIGTAEDGVHIPNQFIKSGRDIFAFLYLVSENCGRTVYKFRIPNKLRPDRTDIDPDPEEQSLIDQAIATLNDAVEQTAADVVTTTAKAAEATEAAELASYKALVASDSATAAGTYATRAETAQNAAESARDTATAKATAAATSADNAALSAVNALDSASDAAISAGQASASASAAVESALDAKTYRDSAGLSAENAAMYAEAASGSATSALASATTATTKASEAAQSASDASTAQTAAEDARDEAQRIVDGIVMIEDTASGTVASFPDGADDVPMRSLKVSIDPVQDLHGYDNPWPAGGGKNLLNFTAETSTVNGITFTVNSDGTISATGTATANATLISPIQGNVSIGENYILNGCPSGGGNGTYEIMIIAKNYNTSYANEYGNGVQFTYDDDHFGRIQLVVRAGNTVNIVFKPMIRLASVSDATFAPYSNICPISGWTGAQVVRTGKNLLSTGIGIAHRIENLFASTQIDTTNKTVTFSPVSSEGYKSILYRGTKGTTKAPFEFVFPFKENTQYTFIIKATTTVNVFHGGVSYTDGTNNGGFNQSMVQNGYIVFTSPANKTVLSLYLGIYSGVTTFWYEEMGVYEGVVSLADADFTPRNTYSVSWETEAGTVYGGTLDVVSGELVVDRAEVDAGTLTWANNVTGIFSTQLDGMTNANAQKVICSIYGYGVTQFNWNYADSYADKTINTASNSYIYIKDTSYSDAATFKTAMDGVQLVYELATPIVYHLTPTEVRTLLGQNNVWADTGDSEATYKADTKLYINKRITEIVN